MYHHRRKRLRLPPHPLTPSSPPPLLLSPPPTPSSRPSPSSPALPPITTPYHLPPNLHPHHRQPPHPSKPATKAGALNTAPDAVSPSGCCRYRRNSGRATPALRHADNGNKSHDRKGVPFRRRSGVPLQC